MDLPYAVGVESVLPNNQKLDHSPFYKIKKSLWSFLLLESLSQPNS